MAGGESLLGRPWFLFGGRLLVWLDGRPPPFVHLKVGRRVR
jgi:hypothetical protein